ncbi:hypothetical protein PVAP13_9NG120473 [Panicum virgatum]|uniref:Uncharacterized protein n=1 Tax=Panicum virgatum TaxID=38727 RepID=A0A8T0MHG3_PANVG|nr:hypothetical protein PVAP13_9NG120473 [Panicum virgatum]
MSRSRRTRRAAEHEQTPALAESPRVVSNPIFRCEAGPSQPERPPAPDDQLRCVYRPTSLYALVHDPASAASDASCGIGKPLPLPPCRAHRAGPGAVPRVPGSRTGPAGGPRGRALWRAPPDPFLAAYVACSKSAGGGKDATAAGVDRPQQKHKKQGSRKKKRAAKKKVRQGEEEEVARGCGGIWSGGWAAGAKYAGAMSCRHGCGCAVADQQQVDAPAAAAKKAAAPTLDLSWAPAVLSARALERRREQR